ncbi:radical SAM protein [Candidatus Microgenomates bacterium]|nr:radical SAM protein [Candidatus Microgenomates bacterium]
MPVGEKEPQFDEFRAFTGDKQGPVRIIGAGLDISEACNLACPDCYRPNSEGQSGYMMAEIAFPIMKKLRENGATEVYFLGAEPTLNPELPQILQKAVDLGFDFALLISNGLKLADKRYAHQVLIPGISLLMHRHTLDNDALAQRIQEASVGKPGTLEQSHTAWENAQKIFRQNGENDKLMMQCCLTEPVMTGDNLSNVFRWARENLRTLPIMEYVAPPHTGKENQLEWLATYPSLTRQVVKQLKRFRQIDFDLGLQAPSIIDAVSPQAYNTACTMLCEGGQIRIDGGFGPCTNMGPDSTHPAQFGNILFEPFEHIEQSVIRRAFLQPNFRVKNCNDPCQGSGCWWTGLVTTGCYRLCQLNCIFNEEKQTIDDIPDLCDDCQLDQLRKEGALNCGSGTRPGLVIGDEEKSLFDA